MSKQLSLDEVISMSWFTVDEAVYVYARVKEFGDASQHFMTINDGEELTVVTREENLAVLGDYEVNKDRWKLLNIRCGNPFYCAGFIARITAALAEKGIDVLLTSSYSSDLVLVMERDLEEGVEVLNGLGFSRRA